MSASGSALHSPESSPVIPGDFNSFTDITYLHSSQYSNVYRAFDTNSGKFVVLKTINEGFADDRGASILENEYNILTKISSDFVPRAVEYSVFGDGHCLALEYIEGVSLLEYLKDHRISEREFLHIAPGIVRAISDVHDSGFIHKDISPGNIIYNNSTRKATLIDFGSATEFSRERSMVVDSKVPDGSLLYISPEQTGRMNHALDFRSDFYSLGVTFFEMLCGRPPFDSENQAQILYMHLAKAPPYVHEVEKNVPLTLSRLVAKLMAKMPEDRYRRAAGILNDLAKCLALLESGNAVAEFDLGEGDYSDRFEIPEKTYGRFAELAALEAAYGEVSRKGKVLVSMAGRSGIGKTTLVGELHRHLAESNGIFVYGKYDQYHRNIPYVAISQALERFCDFVLSEDEESMGAWKARISAALKKDGRLIIDRISGLELLAGEPDPLPELSPLEERTRFKAALQELLAAITSPGRIIVMFFDDVHLANAGSFELIEEIMDNAKIEGLLILACYRDNEVDEGHPLIRSVEMMLARGVDIRRIELVGLDAESTANMIADALHREVGAVEQLSSVVYGKTRGNPFYIRQFLTHCHNSGYLRFDHEARSWVWELDKIKQCEAEENVVDFLVRNLHRVRPETRIILSLAACIGRTFNVTTLVMISGKDGERVLRELKQAVDLELVYPLVGGMGPRSDFQFSHDRFQQAFFTILPEEERSEIHWRLARYYEESGYAEDEFSERQFILADSYFKAFSALPGLRDRRMAAAILLKTAKTAALRSAFATALRYLELLVQNMEKFDADGDFRFSTYSEYHSTLCGMAKYAEADKVYALLEGYAKEPIVLTDSCCLQAISLSNRGRYKDAFMLGVGLLGKLGVPFQAENLQAAIVGELGSFYSELGAPEFPGVELLPRSDSLLESAIAKLLNRISTAGLFYNAFCAFWAILTNAKRVLEQGYTRDGLPLYGSLTLVLIPFRNDYRLSYDLALGAMKLAEKNGYRVFRMYHLFSLVNSHWYEDWKTGLSYARESCRGNTAFGDFEFACFSYFTTQQLVLETCPSIDDLVGENGAAMAYAERYGNLHAMRSFVSFRQFSKAMTGETSGMGSFDGNDFSEAAHLGQIADNQMALCFFSILRALSAAIYMDFERVFELTEKAQPWMPSITGFYFTALCRFLHSLSICKRLESGSLGQEDADALREKLAKNQKWLGERAADAPNNFMQFFDLIEAERKALGGEMALALLHYEKAIAGARKSGRPYHFALACDLAAQRFLALKAPMTAANFLREAHQAYRSWGARGKVEQLRQKYIGFRLFEGSELKWLSPRPMSGAGKAFDLDSLILASQKISRETRVEALLSSLMNVLRENAGAENIYYLNETKGVHSIMAECHAYGETALGGEAGLAPAGRVSIKIVNYVARSRETVVLDNAAASDIYGGDEYISERGCKSVMCLPIVNKGELKGILYLENNLIEGAFDETRIDALKTIAAQLAISLENAYLFDNLQRLVDEKTRELREEIAFRKDAEKRLEHMANRDTLTNLPNRRMFHSCLNSSIELSLMKGCTLAVLFIDLDGFKAVNDKHGHDKGDQVLVETARRLIEAVRGGDTVSRLGGDEFTLILENVKSIGEIETVCLRIIASVREPIELDGKELVARVTSSIGVSILRVDGEASEELIAKADSAMYEAKRNGKNQFVFNAKDYKTLQLNR